MPSSYLVVEPVDLGDLPAFVITTEDGNAAAEPHLQCYQQSDRLHAVVASVYVVSHEQIVRVRGLSYTEMSRSQQ